MVGRWRSFWEGLFSGAMLVSGRVHWFCFWSSCSILFQIKYGFPWTATKSGMFFFPWKTEGNASNKPQPGSRIFRSSLMKRRPNVHQPRWKGETVDGSRLGLHQLSSFVKTISHQQWGEASYWKVIVFQCFAFFLLILVLWKAYYHSSFFLFSFVFITTKPTTYLSYHRWCLLL